MYPKIEVADRCYGLRCRGLPELLTHSDAGHVTASLNKPAYLQAPFGVGRRLFLLSDGGALLRSRPMRSVELPVALFDAASPLVPGKGGADMVRASAPACRGDFLLRLAGCQPKNPIAQVR